MRVTNTGKREGAEVVQLYLGSPAAAEEPPKQLKGFEKILLKPGESKVVTMKLDKDSLAAWDTESHAWKVYPGHVLDHGRQLFARHPPEGCIRRPVQIDIRYFGVRQLAALLSLRSRFPVENGKRETETIKESITMKSNRREFFETIGVGAAGVAVGAGILSSASCGSPENKEEDGQILLLATILRWRTRSTARSEDTG